VSCQSSFSLIMSDSNPTQLVWLNLSNPCLSWVASMYPIYPNLTRLPHILNGSDRVDPIYLQKKGTDRSLIMGITIENPEQLETLYKSVANTYDDFPSYQRTQQLFYWVQNETPNSNNTHIKWKVLAWSVLISATIWSNSNERNLDDGWSRMMAQGEDFVQICR